MHNLLLSLEIALGVIFLLSGIIILLLRNRLKERLSWLREYSQRMVVFICIAKITGAIGLLVPVFFDSIRPVVPFAAAGIGIIMILALRYHTRRRENKDIPATVVFFLVAAAVTYLSINNLIN